MFNWLSDLFKERVVALEAGETTHITRIGFKSIPEIKKAEIYITPIYSGHIKKSLFKTNRYIETSYNVYIIFTGRNNNSYKFDWVCDKDPSVEDIAKAIAIPLKMIVKDHYNTSNDRVPA